MKLKDLFEKVKKVGGERGLKRMELCMALHISINTYVELDNDGIEKTIPNMSNRQKMAYCVVVAKLCYFIQESAEPILKEIFPDINSMWINQAISSASKYMDSEPGAASQFILEDLEFIKLMMTQSTTPLTFKDVYNLLCRFRLR